jgi:hypothetical protein
MHLLIDFLSAFPLSIQHYVFMKQHSTINFVRKAFFRKQSPIVAKRRRKSFSEKDLFSVFVSLIGRLKDLFFGMVANIYR